MQYIYPQIQQMLMVIAVLVPQNSNIIKHDTDYAAHELNEGMHHGWTMMICPHIQRTATGLQNI